MQDAHDPDVVSIHAVNDHMGADQIGQMRRRQVVAAMTKLRVVADRL